MIQTTIYDEIIDFLAALNPQKVLGFHPSDENQQQIELLLEKNREKTLNEKEQLELDYYLMLEHIIRMAKAKALQTLTVS